MHFALLTHEFDKDIRPRLFRKPPEVYLIQAILAIMRERGHQVSVARGLKRLPKADAAIAHLDCSITPPDYVEAFKRYPLVVNGRITDITKRRISQHLLSADDDWPGKVIVKSNFNYAGRPEVRHNHMARNASRPEPHPGARVIEEYPVFDRLADVPAEVWDDPALVVSKLLPEVCEDGYALRIWVFMGERERCTRHIGTDLLLKGASVIRQEPSPVPESIRAARDALGIDYGKIDFAIHDGEPVLFDVNRTPGNPPQLRDILAAGNPNLADGLEQLAKRA